MLITKRNRPGTRRQSEILVVVVPLVSIAFGPDPETGEPIGSARGVIALGDHARGVFALEAEASGFAALGARDRVERVEMLTPCGPEWFPT